MVFSSNVSNILYQLCAKDNDGDYINLPLRIYFSST